MIGIFIKYNDKVLFTSLPKDNEKLKEKLANIGLDISPQALSLTNKNDCGYEVDIYGQESTEIEIVTKICSTDTLGQLNELMQYLDRNYVEDLYDIVVDGSSESIAELYKELTSPPETETIDNFVIKTCLYHKATFYEPSECVVEKVIPLSTEEFRELLDAPLNSYDFITDNMMCMYTDENSNAHCLLAYDKENGDGLLINAEGYDYARYSAYIPHANEIIEQYDLEQSGLKTVKAPITESEKRLLDTVSGIADRIATSAHLGNKDFFLEDIMKDLDCDFDDVKHMILHAVAQKINSRADISAVEVSELDIPFQPEITVTATEEAENMTAEEISGLSY